MCKLTWSQETVIRLPITEERVNSKKKTLEKKEIQREISLYFANPTTLINQLPATENAFTTVNGVKNNLLNVCF